MKEEFGQGKQSTEKPDVAYCYRVLEHLRSLEDSVRRRSILREKVVGKIDRGIYRVGVALALFPAILLVLIFVIIEGNDFGSGQLGTIVSAKSWVFLGIVLAAGVLFVNTYAVFIYLYRKRNFCVGQKWLKQRIYKEIHAENLQLLAEFHELVTQSELAECRIPECFLSTRAVILLIEKMQSAQCACLNEAIRQLQAELNVAENQGKLLPAGENFWQGQRKLLGQDLLADLFE